MEENNLKKYSALVVGSGRIGAGFDGPESDAVLTHAHAYSKHPQINLVGFVDSDIAKASEAGNKWGVESFANIADVFAQNQIDIVSVCVPDEFHASTLREVLAFKPKLVIAEKPLTLSLNESKEIVEEYKKAGVPLVVNFSRRFSVSVQDLKKEIRDKKYGNVISACAIYTKGILHNGSHMIDLARNLFGEVLRATSLSKIVDWKIEDPTVDAFLTFEHCPSFFLTHGDERAFSIFEMDIIFEKARVRYLDDGRRIERTMTIPDPLYDGFTILGDGVAEATDLNNVMYNMVSNAVAHLENSEALSSDGLEALKTQEVCETILNNLK